MAVPIFTVDAFTSAPFAGNPAAVCILAEPRDDDWMRAVAAEMNLSETAFLRKRSPNDFDLRWFTPSVEVDLCGHATLASAHILWEIAQIASALQIRFHTRSGILTADQRQGGWIELNFPAKREQAAPAPENLERALGAVPRYVGKNQMDYLILLDSERALRALRPDFRLLASIRARGIIVTALPDSSDSPFDFLSRFFAPASGIDEDPVTGSAHCCLAPFWSKRLNKTSFTTQQASPRGGTLRVSLAEGDRVLLLGRAITTLRGELLC
jgi:PhzF family phenazine biosynthesis protein